MSEAGHACINALIIALIIAATVMRGYAEHSPCLCSMLNTPMFVWYADIPYAWVNLRHGVGAEELTVQETNTAAVGSFTLEFGLLSRLTGQLTSALHLHLRLHLQQ